MSIHNHNHPSHSFRLQGQKSRLIISSAAENLLPHKRYITRKVRITTGHTREDCFGGSLNGNSDSFLIHIVHSLGFLIDTKPIGGYLIHPRGLVGNVGYSSAVVVVNTWSPSLMAP